jgi:phage tail sheath protein FI
MAERFISPGVFTRENDLSFLPTGIAQIGAAFIGPTLKGPAFRPIIVESQEDFEALFGATTVDFYTPYAVRNYLEESSTATIVRVLGLSGYSAATYKSARLTVSGSQGEFTVAYLHPSRTGITISSGSVSGPSDEFTLVISGANGITTFTSMSIDTTSDNYIGKVLGTGPTTGKDAYVYAAFPSAVNQFPAGTGSMAFYANTGVTQLNLSGSTYGTYSNAHTPMIRSQEIGGQKYDLFRFYTLGDGVAANSDVKISVASVRADPLGLSHGTFSIIVRKASDTDAKLSVLEQFDNLTLDTTSANYIAKRIGTARTVIENDGDVYLEGDYPNNSKYVYVDMADGIEDVPIAALPYGFAALSSPITLNSSIPAPAYITTRYYTPAGGSTAVANNKVYYGFDYTDVTSLSWLRPLPSGSYNSDLSALVVGVHISGSTYYSSSQADAGFDMSTMLSSSDATDIAVSSATSIRKFTVPFQGGFDGQNPAITRLTGASLTSTNTMGFDLSDADADGAQAYVQAITAISNPDAYDINMLVLPGVVYSQHAYVAQKAIDVCEDRGDAFYIMDPEVLGANVSSVITSIESLDTNYCGVYHPWVKVFDAASNKNIWVPPSVVMAGVYAFNDRVAAEWYAPAGLNRGGIPGALQVRARLDQSDRDDLYESRINPIAQFPAQGIVAWGQKTLQVKASAFDRINVRRLLIAVKKFIASTSRYIVFEQNVESTRQRFLSIVNPYLSSIQERNGLYAFKVKMDDSNNTPEIIDRNILVGELWLQPTRTAEFISLTFNVLPTGATFPE